MKLIQTKAFSHSIIWVIFLLSVVPIAILGYFNHPSVADDYCFAYMTRDYGFWEGQRLYYEGWSGRYISNMLFHASPLAFGYFGFVKIMPVLILALLFHSFYLMIGEFIPTSRSNKLVLTGAFLSLYIAESASIIDNFFWYTSVFIFPISVCYWMYLVAVLIRYYSPQYQSLQNAIALLCATLVFFIVGSNEVVMLMIIAFLGLVWLYFLLFEKRFDKFFTMLGIVAVLCAYFLVIKAPGNQVRMQGGALSGNIVLAITKAIKSTFKDSFHWVVYSPLLPMTLLFAAWYQKFVPNTKIALFKTNLLYTIVSLGVLLTLMFFAIHYGNPDGVPDRVKNAIYVFFLAGWFYLILSILNQFPKLMTLSLHNVVFVLGLTAWSLFAWSKSSNLRIMYADIRSGNAKGYDEEMTARYKLIQESKADTIYVTPLKHAPKTLYFDEIKDNQDHLWNKCYATYFKKKVIVMKK